MIASTSTPEVPNEYIKKKGIERDKVKKNTEFSVLINKSNKNLKGIDYAIRKMPSLNWENAFSWDKWFVVHFTDLSDPVSAAGCNKGVWQSWLFFN